MSFGDEIMASGHARVEYEKHGRKVQICGRDGRPRWSDLWAGLIWIAKAGEQGDFAKITNGPQARPYIRYPFTRALGQRWTGWRARDHIGTIVHTDAEMKYATMAVKGLPPFMIVEPNIPSQSNPNKQWGRANWQELANVIRAAGYRPVQLGPRGTAWLADVYRLETPTFRHASAILKFAFYCFLPEGGLHHAAAALGVNATVLFGGATDPNVTGYPTHNNIVVPPACGKWTPCPHCRDAWAQIKPTMVFGQRFKTELGIGHV